ncbi:unnamed protein product [Didymodactylos carnosus]|uniref:Kinesin light chain n=1 Tax=Didymodactylos carnosus TaxID=1234261 RepID=A0A8S2QMK8_9BILA|nr:unnamed protein product [Didymodactylos carnosus]CAF4111729.1 unnamed protein product [Didymodactylos carnosus]
MKDVKAEYDRAFEYYERSLKLREKCLPADHPHIATSLNNIASAYCAKGGYDRAFEWHERSVKIREKYLPANHPHIAIALNDTVPV